MTMIKTAIPILVLLLGVALFQPLLAQSQNTPASKEAGLPYIQNFSPKDYGAHAQNWAILQDQRGVMYFGNADGILEYDGASWRLIRIANRTLVRSLAMDESGRIYVGAQEDFGYLAPDASGQMQFVSMLAQVKPEDRDFFNVWKTYATPQGIYFKTYDRLYHWSNDRFNILRFDTNSIVRSRFVHGKVYLQHREVGLLQVNDSSVKLVIDVAQLKQASVKVLLPYPAPREVAHAGRDAPGHDVKNILIGARQRGLFLFDGSVLKPFASEANEFLRKNLITNGTVLADGSFALSTSGGGLVIIDRQGQFRHILNKAAGLRNDQIQDIYTDRQGGLWLALNNGLARVEIPAPLSFHTERLGLNSTVYTLTRHQGRLFAGTSLGIYSLQPPATPGNFPVFQTEIGPSEYTWSLLSIDDLLLAATAFGLYRIQHKEVTRLGDIRFVRCFYHSQYNRNLVFVGYRGGLGILKKNNGQWQLAGRIEGFSQQIGSVVEDTPGNLWLGSRQGGYLNVKIPGLNSLPPDSTESNFFSGKSLLPVSGDSVMAIVEYYGVAQGVSKGSVRVYDANGRVVFATQKGLRRFDPERKVFVPDSAFGAAFADTTRAIDFIAEARQGGLWFKSIKNKQEINLLMPRANARDSWNRKPFLRLANLGNISRIYPDPGSGNGIWFYGPTTEGIIRLDTNIPEAFELDYPALIRRVVTRKDSVIYGGATTELYPEFVEGLAMTSNKSPFEGGPRRVGVVTTALPYTNNALRFEYARPHL